MFLSPGTHITQNGQTLTFVEETTSGLFSFKDRANGTNVTLTRSEIERAFLDGNLRLA